MASHGLFQDWQRAGWKGGIKSYWNQEVPLCTYKFSTWSNNVLLLKRMVWQRALCLVHPGGSNPLVWEKGKKHMACLQWPRGPGLCLCEMEGHMWVDPFHFSFSPILQMLSPNGSFASAGSKNFFFHAYIHFLHCLVKEVALPSCLGIWY